MSLSGPRDEGPREPPWKWVALVVVLGVVGFVFMDSPAPPAAPGPSADASASALPSGGVVAQTPRCVRSDGPPFRVGPADDANQGLGGDTGSLALPFSAEVGRGVAFDDGFAVGVKRDREGGAWAEVAVVSEGVTKLVGLGRSRGDMDAPVVASAGASWVAGMFEPHAGGLSLRLARPEGDAVTFGAEFEQSRDESLAADLAVASKAGVVVWDEVVDDGGRAVIRGARIDPDSLEARGAVVELSSGHDAEVPRVIAFDGGFWVAWVARARRDEPTAGAAGGRYAAERIDPSWIEVRLLDREGAPAGAPRAVTPLDGHVLAFDVAPASDGQGLLVAWRDDDTPSGAHGGDVLTTVVEPSGAAMRQPVAEDDVGAGVPSWLDGWITVADREGRARLAPTGADGVLLGALQTEEAALGTAQLLAGRDGTLLAAQPAGRAVELFTVRCDASVGRIVPTGGRGGAR